MWYQIFLILEQPTLHVYPNNEIVICVSLRMNVRITFVLLSVLVVIALGFEDYGRRRERQSVNSRGHGRDRGHHERVKTREDHHQHRWHRRR